MRTHETAYRTGLWLACGGFLILIAYHLIAYQDTEPTVANATLTAGAIFGNCAIGAGICVSIRAALQQSAQLQSDPTSPLADTNAAAKSVTSDDFVLRLSGAFNDWRDTVENDTNLWCSFDQWLREALVEHCSATRVRCFRVQPDDGRLYGLSQDFSSAAQHDGILTHVARTGLEFVAGDDANERLIQQLAGESDASWEWICPIRHAGRTTGLVAVGKVTGMNRAYPGRRRLIARLCSMYWMDVATLDALRIARRTDKASGVLTRRDFFEQATGAVAASHEESEPLVLLVLALEGLRTLDDSGRWQERDALVEAVGRVLVKRVRTDDIVGRLSDDRFVVLLRRLDEGLGRLIAEKLLNTVHEHLTVVVTDDVSVQARIGLSAGGPNRLALQNLLAGATTAIREARSSGISMCCAARERDKVESAT